jgi:hypothetical protein
MAEKGGTKILAIVTICIILVSIGFSGCVEDDEKEIKIEYRLEIETNTNDPYTIIAPFFSNEKLRSKIEINDGDGDIYFVKPKINNSSQNSSNYGIEIRGIGNNEIFGRHVIKYDGKKHKDDVLSFGDSNSYWVYCDKNNTQEITIKIEASFTTFTDGESWYSISDNDGKIKLEAGWNLINIEENSWES